MPPKFVATPLSEINSDFFVNVTINCTATGIPRPNLTWTRNNISIGQSPPFNVRVLYGYESVGVVMSQLILTDVTRFDHAGMYACNINNDLVERRSLSSNTLLKIYSKVCSIIP